MMIITVALIIEVVVEVLDLFPISSGKAYAVGFAAGFLLWWGSAFFFNFANAGMLAGKMGELIGNLNSAYMLMITGTMGGILAGFGTLTGVLGNLFSNLGQNNILSQLLGQGNTEVTIPYVPGD